MKKLVIKFLFDSFVPNFNHQTKANTPQVADQLEILKVLVNDLKRRCGKTWVNVYIKCEKSTLKVTIR